MKNTLLSRMGFEDHELKTPLHDEICMWAQENMPTVVKEYFASLIRSGWVRDVGELTVVKIEWESPVRRGYGPIIGFHDIYVEGVAGEVSFGFGIEVKSSIRSAGELIRQLRTTGTKVVVCPDDRFSELLRGQGFGFVKYPGPVHIAGDLFND